jgi:membrane fusion protein, multidrug efflux system
MEPGQLEAVAVQEGQEVKEGDLMFTIKPSVGQKKLETKSLDEAVSIKAPFNGLIGRLTHQQGSRVEEGDVLATLSDDSVMSVEFNVPEARYLALMASLKEHPEETKIELLLANGKKFDQPGKLAAIDAGINNQNGNIALRADFPNPDGLLRNGLTGRVLISRSQKDAIVIPQLATFEVLSKQCVYVVDKDNVAHRREIACEEGEGLDNLFIVTKGLSANEKIVVEWIRQVRDGEKVE